MKRIMWGLAILIIPAFIIWGAGMSTKNKTKKFDYAGKLFGKKISHEYYYNMWNVARDYAVKAFGNNVPTEFIDQVAWSRIILLEQANSVNLRVTDQEVVQKIASFPVFQRKNGIFDPKLYKSMLGDTARAFEEKLRDDIIIEKLRENVTANISVTDEEVKNEYRKKFEKVKSSYILIPFADFENVAEYKDSNLLNFYEKNKTAFKKSEQVNVKYIEILLSNPNAEELAYKVLDQVNQKKNLEEPAKSNSLEIKETGFFTANEEIPNIGWSYDFTKASFSLRPQEINNMLIKTDKGVYIIQVKERKPPYLPDFNEVKDAVKNSYIKEMSIKLSEKKAEKLFLDMSKDIKNNGKFENEVEKRGLQIKQTDFITRDGYVQEIGPAKEFIDLAFFLKPGEISKPLKTIQAWAILAPIEFQPIDEGKYIEEKEKFKENLLANKKLDAFNKYFEELKKESGFVSYTER